MTEIKLDEAALEKARQAYYDNGKGTIETEALEAAIKCYLTETKLLEKLKAAEEGLERIEQADTSSLFSIDFYTGESSRVAGLVPKEIAQQTLKQIRGADAHDTDN